MKRAKLSPSPTDSWADVEKTASEFAKEEELKHFKLQKGEGKQALPKVFKVNGLKICGHRTCEM